MRQKPTHKVRSQQLNKETYASQTYYQSSFILSKNYSKRKVFKVEYILLGTQLIHLNHNLHHKFQEALICFP